VAELVDALDSKSSNSNVVRVRFPPPVQNKIIRGCLKRQPLFFCYFKYCAAKAMVSIEM
jgi:hypothetical protein